MSKKKPEVIYKKSRSQFIEVNFTPETKMEVIHCPAKYAHGIYPEPNVRPKKGTKIKFNDWWKV